MPLAVSIPTRGALFSFSVLAALGRHLAEGGDVFAYAAALVADDAAPGYPRRGGAAPSGGRRTRGKRWQASTARKAAKLLQTHDPLTALLWLMAHTEDSNLYHRGGVEGAAFVGRALWAPFLAAPPEQRAALTYRRWTMPSADCCR